MASPEVQTVSTGADKAKLAAAGLLILGAFVAYYVLGRHGGWVQWTALVLCVIAAVGVYLTSDSGKRLLAFSRDSYRELAKVVWPERKEAVQMTIYVFVFVLVMAVFLWLTDKTIEWVFYDLILGWRA
jgi:preprotein translocase subunit SecE